jgi:hypothetical protein
MEIQTRESSDAGDELRLFTSVRESNRYALDNPDVWKISMTLPSGERLRLVPNCPRST